MAKTFEEDLNTVDKILADWDKDSILDRSDFTQAEADRQAHHSKYLRVYSHNRINIIKAEEELKDMRRLRSAFYAGELTKEELDAHGWGPFLGKSPKTQTQREELVESDPLIIEITKRKKLYENIVEVASLILKEINTRGYSNGKVIEWEVRIANG